MTVVLPKIILKHSQHWCFWLFLDILNKEVCKQRWRDTALLKEGHSACSLQSNWTKWLEKPAAPVPQQLPAQSLSWRLSVDPAQPDNSIHSGSNSQSKGVASYSNLFQMASRKPLLWARGGWQCKSFQKRRPKDKLKDCIQKWFLSRLFARGINRKQTDTHTSWGGATILSFIP